jgi:hypothetical protein
MRALPILVIEPRRTVSPVDRSDGTSPSAHSGDLERSFRSIMNTDSGDHEHRPEPHGGPLLLTVFNQG